MKVEWPSTTIENELTIGKLLQGEVFRLDDKDLQPIEYEMFMKTDGGDSTTLEAVGMEDGAIYCFNCNRKVIRVPGRYIVE